MSVVSLYQANYKHNLNWDNIQILDSEPFFQKRLISEMIFIKKRTMSLNKQDDTDRLPDIYFPALNINCLRLTTIIILSLRTFKYKSKALMIGVIDSNRN